MSLSDSDVDAIAAKVREEVTGEHHIIQEDAPQEVSEKTRFSWGVVVAFVGITAMATNGLWQARAAAEEVRIARAETAALDSRTRAIEVAAAALGAENRADHVAIMRELKALHEELRRR